MKVGNEHIYKLTLLLIDGLALIGPTGYSESSYICILIYVYVGCVNVHYLIDVIMLYQELGIISFHNIPEKINKYVSSLPILELWKVWCR